MDSAARGVLDVARGVLADLDLEVILNRVLDSARELTGARYAALGVLDSSGTELARFLTQGIDEANRAVIGDLPRGRGVLGELIENPAPLRLEHVSRHPRSWGFPSGHPPMETFLGVPILVDGRPYGNLYLSEKDDGGQFSDADEEAVVLLAEFAGVALDHARRYSGARSRRDELERTVAALDATVQIARAVGGETNLDLILELVAKRGRALVSARVLLVELVRGDRLVVAAGAGEVSDGLLGAEIAVEETVAGAALRTRRPQRLEDDLNRSRFQQHGLGHMGVSAASGLVVPLLFRDRGFGALVALDRIADGPGFTAEDERLLEAFAASAATAVATAEAFAAGRRLQRLEAAEGERRRWARELHDETLQNLAAIKMLLAASSRSGGVDAGMDVVVERLDAEIANLRALITDLRPPALDDYGVEGAVASLAERMSRHGIQVTVSADLAWENGRTPTRLSPELETAVYRIVQESLTNAAKHGAAAHAVVRLEEADRQVRIMVNDDGAGFDPSAKTEGFGLLGMRERVELFDGTLEIDSTPGEGTIVRVSLPAERRPASAADSPPVREAGNG